ncbi:HAMP domain-containing sensor histidine kinase [Kiloniella laminariae]|uniref:histidine kinase n=1 Tax=Kiloniella laminariae TaxID=454162 RepID=A0ABT4LNQ4_9PROT|nr:HAMP domain-containing sensor histidine kinase [Kiloniella laminariae]MCZ4282731.1 HAMP domain-containing sensor histidine kinase [Kiloniella laminariae]
MNNKWHWLLNWAPERIRVRILLFGFFCGFLASSFAAGGIGAIINRRAEIAEATWIGPVIARAFEELSRMPEERRSIAANNFNRSNSVLFNYYSREKIPDNNSEYFIDLTRESIISLYPNIRLGMDGAHPRSKLLLPDYPPEDLTAHLTFLTSAIARHDRPASLYLRLSNGDQLVVNSPVYWRERVTEVQWLLILLGGMSFSAVLFILGIRYLLYSFRYLGAIGTGSKIGRTEESNINKDSPLYNFWPKEAREIVDQLYREQEEKTEAIEERTRMLTAISHDLRTPATRLRLRAEFIEEEDLRNKILADLDLMLSMTKDAIDFLKGGLEAEELEQFDIVSMVQSICDDFSDVGMPVTFLPIEYPTLRTSGTVFSRHEKTVSLDGLLKGYMVGRPRALKRAITNLVANAVKYGFQAKVGLTIEPGLILIEVNDRGPGIPEAEMDNVLKPFYRLEKSRNRETGGSGLGLSIVKSVADSHRGELELANQPVQGLSVKLLLPRSLDPDVSFAP